MKFSLPVKFPISAVPSDFGVLLATARRARGWTQARLAKAAGIGRETVSRLEAGRRRPVAETVFRLQAALELEPGDLVPTWPEWHPIGLSGSGTRSRERRRSMGLSLQHVAAAAGVSVATLSRFERDIGEAPSLLREASGSCSDAAGVLRLAQALGFDDTSSWSSFCGRPSPANRDARRLS